MKRWMLYLLVLALGLNWGAGAAAMTITLSAAGDVVLGGDPEVKSALGRSSEETFAALIAQYGLGYPFENVRSYFAADDVTIVNLECAMTNRDQARNKSHVLRAKPQYAAILTGAGVEVCNLANNHSRDFGDKGLKNTRTHLTRAGIRWCDGSNNGTYTVKKDGQSVKIGFAGFQTPTSLSKMRTRIKALSRKCDLVVASFHWCDTKEWTQRIYPSDRRMARAAIAAGADLVLGHHRHVPAGVEMYKGRYIAYDLGNFVVGIKHLLDSSGRPLTDSMIFQWTVTLDDKKRITDQSIRVIPCTTSTTTATYPATDAMGTQGAPVNNFRPAVLTGQRGRELLERIQALSTVEIS